VLLLLHPITPLSHLLSPLSESLPLLFRPCVPNLPVVPVFTFYFPYLSPASVGGCMCIRQHLDHHSAECSKNTAGLIERFNSILSLVLATSRLASKPKKKRMNLIVLQSNLVISGCLGLTSSSAMHLGSQGGSFPRASQRRTLDTNWGELHAIHGLSTSLSLSLSVLGKLTLKS
jgi:hypothetical protein